MTTIELPATYVVEQSHELTLRVATLRESQFPCGRANRPHPCKERPAFAVIADGNANVDVLFCLECAKAAGWLNEWPVVP